MGFRSFFQFFNRTWRKKQPITKNPPQPLNAKLMVEMLERRDLLTVPGLVAAGVLPLDGTSVNSGSPIIQVQFTETMSNSVLNPGNYVLLGSSGNSIPIDSVSFFSLGAAPVNSAVRLSYNGGAPMVVDNYTLFVRGDQMIDQDEGLAMSQPGQLIVANSGSNKVSVLGMPGDGTLAGLSNYNYGAVGGQAANPRVVGLADVDSDGIKDLIVVNAGTNQVLIFQGQSAAVGGGYKSSATLTLNLPTGTANTGKALLLTDLNKDGKADIVVANTVTNNISVYLNTSGAVGTVSFGSGTNLATDASPVDLVAGDFNLDGNTDIAVAINAVTGGVSAADLNGDSTNDYRVNIFPGDGNGGFGTMVAVRVGDAGAVGVTAPTSIAVGLMNQDNKPDLVLGGSNGVLVLSNNSTAGSVAFNPPGALAAAGNILSVAVGNLDADSSPDIAAATSTNTIQILRNTNNSGPLTFLTAATIPVAAGTAGKLVLGDLNGDGLDDLVVTNGNAAGRVTVLNNTTVGGSISAATNTNPIRITSTNHGLANGQRITITGAQGNTAANGTFTVTLISRAISNSTASGGVISVTSTAHGLTTGERVTITGSAFTEANGTFTVTVTDANHFTLNGTNATGSGAGGTWTSKDRFSIGVAGNGAYTGGATWALTGDVTSNIGNATNTSAIVITSSNHGLFTGESVTITGVLGNTAANGTFTITVIDSDHFSLNSSTGNGAYTSGGTWVLASNITGASNANPIVINSQGHGLATGQRVTITGVTGNTNANGTFTITVLSADTFSLNGSTGNASFTGGGLWALTGNVTAATNAAPIVITSNAHGLKTGQIVTVAGATGNTAANGTFTVTVLTANTFSLNGSTGNGAYAGGATWTVNYTPTSVSNTSPIVITSTSHGLKTGDAVVVSGVTGNTAANGTFTVTVVDADRFILNGSTGNGNYVSGGTWTTTSNFAAPLGSMTANGIATTPIAITTTIPHGLTTGNTVTFGSVSGSLASTLNGNTFTITVVDANHFTLDNTTTAGDASGGFYLTSGGTVGPVGAPYAVDGTPMGVAIGDTNQDGRLDIVTANNTSNDVSLLLGAGGGAMAQPANLNIGPTVLSGTTVADLNGDGLPDIIVFNNNGSNNSTKVSILQGQIGGTYAAPVDITPAVTGRNMRSLSSITAADVNGDGWLDLVFANTQDNTVGFLRNNITVAGTKIVTASFTAITEVGVGKFPTQVAMGDFNNDGKLDMAVSHNGSGGGSQKGITVRLGNGNFTFQNSFELDGSTGFGNPGTPMSGLVLGDFDRDGNLDIVGLEDATTGSVRLHLGNGKGAFGNNGTFKTNTPNPGAIAAADFNGDGYLDVVASSKSTTAGAGNAGISVLLNQLGTGFQTAQQSDVIPQTGLQSILTTDVNQDGFVDVIASTQLVNISGTISRLNSLSPFSIRFSSVNGLSVGMQVQIAGMNAAGMTGADGLWTISAINGFTRDVTLTGSAAPTGTYPNNGPGTFTVFNATVTTNDNVYVLIGKGDGTFQSPVPYLAGAPGAPNLAPSYVVATPTPLVRVTTFSSGGTVVNANLIKNGNFEASDLNGEKGNLLGWQTYDLNTSPGGSQGAWMVQTKVNNPNNKSPLSATNTSGIADNYRAMLDQANMQPFSGNNNPNSPDTYAGTHALYQDITIPANISKAQLSMLLYIDNTNAGVYSDASAFPSLDYRSITDNQQVRVDIMRPTAGLLSVDTTPLANGTVTSATGAGGGAAIIIQTASAHGLTTGSLVTLSGISGFTAANGTFTITVTDSTHFSLNGTTAVGSGSGGTWTVPGDVLRNEFITTPTTALTFNSSVQDLDLTAFAGQTIRLRIAAANNKGLLIVGVDNVRVNVQFADNVAPTLTGLGISNPAFVTAGIAHTNDPTIVGKVNDNAGLAAISYIAFDVNNDGNFSGVGDFKTTTWDLAGNFYFTLQNVPSGQNTIGVQVVDKSGNSFSSTLTFFLQSNSVTEWEAVGPQGIDTTGQGVDYKSVSGRVTVSLPDFSDKLGNTYYVGSANGGIWKTTDGGSHWVSLTNSVTDNAGNPIPVPIGGMAQSISNPSVLYASTGVGDTQVDSRPGVGVLKSTDGGKTWTLIGNSNTVLAGARTTKVVVDPADPNIAYVAVASGGTGGVDENGVTGPAGPGVYKTTDGGLHWKNVLNPASMTYLTTPGNPGTLTTLGAGAPVDSVTDLIIDPADRTRLIIGLGFIGLSPAAGTTGVWYSPQSSGNGWKLVQGADNGAIANADLPEEVVAGTQIGRITVAIGNNRTGNEAYVYALMTTPPGSNTPPSVNWGSFMGLYRSIDNMLNFTKVMLKQDTSAPMATTHSFVDINLFGRDAANSGAMIVDPNNPNVVYVGGSSRWDNGATPNHSLIRIDTGNMSDTTGANTGDDTSKEARAAFQGGVYDPSPGPASDNYVGEGVYWYDLDQGGSSGGNKDYLPDAITSLSFDAQGRLLVGTSGGIWRGVGYGFGYDFTSGNDGILRSGGGGPGGGGNNFSAAGMNFTSINANLQIADMTSVAIDPFQRGVYYTTQIDTGTAVLDPSKGWSSQDLTLNVGTGKIPNAGAVLTANPPPGSPTDTPVSLYRVWQYADPLALNPQTSINNGANWSSIASTGISSNTPAGMFPAFAVNPTPIQTVDGNGNTIYQTVLAFGANVVYTTNTSATVWDQVSGVLSAGQSISAIAFAPSDPNAQTLYAATTDGKVFYTKNKGADNWPNRSTGLPTGVAGSYIRGIAVDPNNANTVFVMYGGSPGTANHVWRSTDAGVTWTNISSTLPSVAAYAMVIDRNAGLGAPAPNGKLYLATEVGVFYSLNNGTNWTRLGQGMPNVPVVDLKYDSGLNVLAAATLGRGVYTINTSAFSFIDDQVVNQNTPSNVIPFTINNPSGTTYTISATSDNQFLVKNSAIIVGGAANSVNRSIQFTPVLNANTPKDGVANITVTITAGTFTYTQSFKVTVLFVNQTPTISAINTQTTTVNQPTGTINFTIGDVETPAGSLIVSATSNNPTLVPNNPANLTLGGSGPNRTLIVTPATGQVGSATITITVTDANVGIGTRTFSLLVSNPATLPFADDFNRSDSTIFLGPSWTINAGPVTLKNTHAEVGVGEGIASLNQLTPAVADVAQQANVSVGVNQNLGLIARYNGGTKNYYLGGIVYANGKFNAVIQKNVNGVLTNIASVPVNFGTGVLRFEVAADSLKLYYGATVGTMTLVAFGNDSAITAAGTVGFRAKNTAGVVTLDDYSANAITLTTPSFPFVDSFTQADGTQLNSNWVNRVGNFAIANNVAVATTKTAFSLATVAGLNQTDGYAQADVNVVGAGAQSGVVVRRTTAGYYYAQILNNGATITANIYRVTGATLTQITTGPINVTGIGGAGTVRLEVVGSALKLFYGPDAGNLSLITYGYDSTYASGSVGIRATSGQTIDEFAAEPITLVTPAAYPFNDDFSTPVNGNQLYGDSAQLSGPNQRNWQDRAGDFVVSGGVLTGSSAGTAKNLATIAGTMTNSIVGASVVVDPAANQEAGVVARYTTAGYYYAQIRSTGTGFTATLYKVVGTTFTALSTPVAVAGTGILRLEVAGPSLKLYYNGGLVSYGFDSQFASGAAGVRASKGATTSIDDFNTDVITLTTPATPPPAYVDDFSTPANTDQLSRDWTERQGNFSINGLQQLVANNTVMNVATVNGISIADTAVQATIVAGAASENIGLIARYQTNGSYYLATVTSNAAQTVFTPKVYRVVNGVFTQLTMTTALPAVSLSAMGIMRFEVVGSSLKLFWDGALVSYGYDAGIAVAGLTGLRVSKNVILDDFTVDLVTPAAPTLPFTDDFSTAVNGNQLAGPTSRTWDERAGNIIVTGGQAIGNTTGVLSMATIHDTLLGNAVVSADISLAASQTAGIFARYQTNGTYYLAKIVSNATATASTVTLSKVVAGVATQLGAAVALPSVSGNLKFEIVGNQLKLFFTPTAGTQSLLAYRFDAGISATGRVGMIASKGATFDSFSTDAITLVAPSTSFADDFSASVNTDQIYGNSAVITTADERNWVEQTGNFTVNGTGQLVGNDAVNSIATVFGLSMVDTAVQADLSVAANQTAGVVARFQNTGNYYYATVSANATATVFTPAIYKVVNGTVTKINLTPIGTVTGAGTLRFEVSGTSLKLYWNGTLVTYAFDASIKLTGLTGVRATKNAVLDAFTADPITLTDPGVPFTDAFTEPANTTLSRDWTERSGLFNFTGTALQAVAASGFSIATVNHPLADSTTQLGVNIPVGGTHTVGLVARYDAATGNTYMGYLTSNNGSITAYLFKKVGATLTQLNKAVLSGATGVGTLRLEVVGGNIKLFYGANPASLPLATYFNDTTPLASGLSGVYLGVGESVTDFSVDAITLTTPTTPFTDTFTDNTGAQLSRDWYNRMGNYSVAANKIVGQAATNLSTVNGLSLGAVSANADVIVGAGQFAGVLVRYQANGSYYVGQIQNVNNVSTAYIYRVDAGVFVQLAKVAVATGTGTLSLRAVGPNLKLFYGASLGTQTMIAYAYDTKYATGTVGIRSSAGANLDTFQADTVAIPSNTLTFTETFAASPPTHQLSNNWTERAGNFNVAAGPATAQSSATSAPINGVNTPLAFTNLATLNGVTTANVDLDAIVNVGINGLSATLVARYSGNPGKDTYYAATVTFVSAGNYKVEIVKVVNGVKTILGTTNVAAFTSGLRFLVVNNNLNVYLDGNALPALTVVDGSIASAGAVGMAATVGAKFNKFTAS